jgi:hypothetical protein
MKAGRRTIVCIAVTTFLAILSVLPGRAIEHKYIEDFTTTQYKDVLNTTAWWDTVAGELRLFPFVPTIVGTCDTPNYAFDVTVSGDHAFVADYSSGLQVIDISDPTNPTLAGTCDTPGDASGVTISGDHAFVADCYSGLQVIDISDPTNPTLAGTCDTPGIARHVTISGDYAFVADRSSGLQVIDISDPTNPTLAGTCDTPGNAYGVTVSGDYAFVADYGSGLQVIDISDPTNPTLAGTCYTQGYARGVTVSGDYAFVVDLSFGLQVIDISDPTNPALAGTCDTPGESCDVTVSGNYAFVADYASGLQVIDISDPTNPTLVGTRDTPDIARGVTVSGDHVFVADSSSGLQVIKISEPTTPAITGTCDTPGSALGVMVAGDHAFVADGSSGLQVIDISDPTSPTLAGTCDTPGAAYGVTVSGDHAFVADYESGLQVIDISDPTNPTLAGTCYTPSLAVGVTVSGDYAFVVDWDYGLQVIDISDPTNPTLVGTCDTPDFAQSVTVSGDHAFVADLFSGLSVIDISDPTNPVIVGTCDTPYAAYGVTVSGDHAFVADRTSGLQVIDISDPTNPTLTGTLDTPGDAIIVTVSGDHAFVADYTSGLQVIDISDPTNPTLTGTCNTPGFAIGVTISGDHAFVADHSSGLQVIQVFQSEVDPDNNIGWSLAVDATIDTILTAHLTATQTDSVTWELSADGGMSWQGIEPDGSWNQMAVPGIDLVWRSTLSLTALANDPVVTEVQIDWLYEAASIDSIVDVQDDQGGYVLTHFTRSGRDFPDEATLPISNYGIWRRVDGAALAAALETQESPMAEKSAAGDTPDLGGMPVITFQGRTYVQSRSDLAASSFPPGTWVWVASVPAVQQDAYIASIPTTVDSSASGTNHAVFVMTAHTTTPSIWYVSEPDSGYSVDNIAPGMPLGLAVAYNTGSGNDLSWDPSAEPDFQYYHVYRGDSETFTPGPGNLAAQTATPGWTDPEYDGWDIHYKVTALDHAGNESDPAGAGTITGDEIPELPESFVLYQNTPNPFNPATTIRFDLPEATRVRLSVYNVKGELVATLMNRHMNEGRKEVSWMARDDGGRSVSSGIYFYRLVAGEFVQTRKMVLLR